MRQIIFAFATSIAFVVSPSDAGPALGAEQLRVVPQWSWRVDGRASIDGSLFAATTSYTHVSLVNKDGVLLWAIPIWIPSQTAFSPDSKWLAACGENDGFVLNLKSGELRVFPQLRGSVLEFTQIGRAHV